MSYIAINVRKIHIDWPSIQAAINESASVRASSKRESIRLVNEKLYTHKDSLMRRFNKHRVTLDLHEKNIGSTLMNTGYGNLFTYVGFKQGSDPAGEIRKYLEDAIKVDEMQVRKTRGELSWRIPIIVPDKDDFNVADIAEIPWLGGINTFVHHIEIGIPGVERYLHFTKRKAASVSGFGLQSKGDIDGDEENNREGMTQPQAAYMSELLGQFIKDMDV